jgi:hypothetical protein
MAFHQKTSVHLEQVYGLLDIVSFDKVHGHLTLNRFGLWLWRLSVPDGPSVQRLLSIECL